MKTGFLLSVQESSKQPVGLGTKIEGAGAGPRSRFSVGLGREERELEDRRGRRGGLAWFFRRRG